MWTFDRPEAILQAVEKWGFLPFFRNEIPGFSIEEHTPREYWFSDTQDGPWEWKGPCASSGRCLYGKFFQNRAGFVSKAWFPDFANYRRDGYDFEGRWEDQLVPFKDKQVYDQLSAMGPTISKKLKAACGYCKDGKKGFDTVITRLQMQTFVAIGDFRYMIDKKGKQYGWGVAEYVTPEMIFGEEIGYPAGDPTPEESFDRILNHLSRLFPGVPSETLKKIIG